MIVTFWVTKDPEDVHDESIANVDVIDFDTGCIDLYRKVKPNVYEPVGCILFEDVISIEED